MSQQQTPIPKKYAGQVIAWDSPARKRIVASGRSFQEARQAAQEAGTPQPLLQRVPHPRRRFIGAIR